MLCDCLSVQVLSMRLIGFFYIESESMGSLGWAQCYWCVSWQFNMYIPDGVNAPLCGRCLDRLCDGYGPLRPDARGRAYSRIYQAGLMQRLGYEVWWIIITQYLHGEFEP